MSSTKHSSMMFNLSAVKASLAYDEETLYQDSEVVLELISNSQNNSIQRVEASTLSMTIGLMCVTIFLATSYFKILPDHVKTKMFGQKEDNENQACY